MTEQRHSALGLHPIEVAPGADPVELLKRSQIVRRTQMAGLVVLLLLALGAGRTLLARHANADVLAAVSAEQSRQYVKTTVARRNATAQNLALPGSARFCAAALRRATVVFTYWRDCSALTAASTSALA